MDPSLIASLGKMGGKPAQQAEVPVSQLNPGESGDNSALILQAINQLQKYLTATDQPDEVALVRSVIILLNGLVAKANNQQLEQLPQDMQQAGAGQPGPDVRSMMGMLGG